MQLTLVLALAVLLPVVYAFPNHSDRQPEDDKLDLWMNEQLGRSQETDSGLEDVGHASPGHAQEHDDFMTAFFQNQENEEDFDAYKMEEEDSDSNAENYIADFFSDNVNSEADTQNDMKEEDVELQDDESNNDEAKEEDKDEWYFPDENEASFEIYKDGGGYILSDDFNDFPDLNMFADIQNSGDPDCEAWKKRMQGAQGKINAIGEKLKTELASANQTIEKYESQQNISCDENCNLKLVCVPSDAGEECVKKVNNTCTVSQPKIDECSRKIPDPKCKAKESTCKSKLKKPAEDAEESNKKLDAIRVELKKQENENKILFNSIPEKCKQMRLKRRKRSSF